MAARGRQGQFRHGALCFCDFTVTLVTGHVRFQREAEMPG